MRNVIKNEEYKRCDKKINASNAHFAHIAKVPNFET